MSEQLERKRRRRAALMALAATVLRGDGRAPGDPARSEVARDLEGVAAALLTGSTTEAAAVR